MPLGCGPGPQWRVYEKQPIDVSLPHWCFSPSPSPSLPFSVKRNKMLFIFFKRVGLAFPHEVEESSLDVSLEPFLTLTTILASFPQGVVIISLGSRTQPHRAGLEQQQGLVTVLDAGGPRSGCPACSGPGCRRLPRLCPRVWVQQASCPVSLL